MAYQAGFVEPCRLFMDDIKLRQNSGNISFSYDHLHVAQIAQTDLCSSVPLHVVFNTV